MRLTIEDNREAIKRYRHIRPAAHGGSMPCSAQCPGSPRTCTLRRGHSGPHVAHGVFKRVVAVWDGGTTAVAPERKPVRAARAPVRRSPGEGKPPAPFKALRSLASRFSMEGVLLFIMAVSMFGFAIDWALRILGWK
jgi:hypothetical protein